MFEFIRSDLKTLDSYTPQPGSQILASQVPLDRLDTNESPYDLPLEIKEKLAWIYQHQLETNRYPDGSHTELKKEIAAYVNESTLSAPERITEVQISVGNGSDELIRSLLIATCLGGEGSILVAQPTFSMYGILSQTLGIPTISIDRSPVDFSIDRAAAEKAIAQTQNPPIRVVFVVHPNSPTGNAIVERELAWLRSLPEHILVVIDEAYFEFSQTSLVTELSQHPNWIILRTFSKAFRLAALRVGYAIAHPQIIRMLEKIRLPYNLPSFSLAAASLVLKHRQAIFASIPETLQERQRVFASLQQISALQTWQSAANFIYARPKHSDRQKLAAITQSLKERGTLIRHTGGGLRITIGTPAENSRTIARLPNLL